MTCYESAKIVDMHTTSSDLQFKKPSTGTPSIWHLKGRLLITLVACICVCSHSASSLPTQRASTSLLPCLTEECLRRHNASEMLRSVDATVDPCADFYAFACNKWIRENPIPADKPEWNKLIMLNQRNQLVIRNALERPDAAFQSQAELKAKRYYESCLDEDGSRERLGAEPMQQLLRQVGGWNVTQSGYNHTGWQLKRSMNVLRNQYNVEVFFKWDVGQFYLNSSQHTLFVMQGGLSLPTRENYLNRTANADVLHAYLEYMVRVAVLLGGNEDAAREQFERVVAFETRLAEISSDIKGQIIALTTIALLKTVAPSIDWQEHLNDAFSHVNLTISSSATATIQLNYLEKLNDILDEYNRTEEGQITLNNYMVWQLICTRTTYLSKPFRDAGLPLRRALIGSAVRPEQWRLCVNEATRVMGFAVGAIFVREVFDDEARRQSQQMVTEIRTAFEENIGQLDWMDADIRKLAIEKAEAISMQIGYPDYILDRALLDEQYGDLQLDASQYFENNDRASQFQLLRKLRLYSQSANRTIWERTPALVNAFYAPLKNQITLPAAILQPPVYDVHYAKSFNFGGIGMTIGHELTHAFDDQGKITNKEGTVNPWWNLQTEQRFIERADCLVEQFNEYRVNGRAMNGRRTLGENIADNGGLKAAYRAFERTLEATGADAAGSNFTERQSFFLSFAQFWCSASTEEMADLSLDDDTHTPFRFRVIGSLSNLPEFSDAFGCPLGSPMNPVDKCEIW